MSRTLALVILAVVAVTIASCMPGPNDRVNLPNEDGKVAGFWDGLWQGIIAPVTFIISLFSRSVAMYEVHNNGIWYNLGYLMGIAIILGGSGGGAASRRRRR